MSFPAFTIESADPLAGALRSAASAMRRGGGRDSFDRFRNDPVSFASDVLQVQPWARQVDVLNAVRDNRFTAIRSGHKVSKSNSASILALWWVRTRLSGRVILTAPANHQVKNILWPEVRTMYGVASPPLGGTIYNDPHSGLKLGDKRGIFGLTTDKPERIAGLSGSELLFIVDEASGYPEELFTAIFGNLAGGGKVVLFGNPTRTSGTFFNAFHSKAANWKTLHISSLESPNFHGGNIPGLATPEWETWARDEWGGEGSPLYEVRVLGNFPSQSSNAVIALALVEEARDRWAITEGNGRLEAGIDVARDGDDESVISCRRGLKAFQQEVLRGMDGSTLGEAVVRHVRGHRQQSDVQQKPRIKVDSIGVGTSVLDYIVHNYSREFDIVGVNTACSADEWLVVGPDKKASDEYVNLRAQIGFGLRNWLKLGGAIPDDGKLHAELVAPTFAFGNKARILIEDKREIKKRLGRSPDRADALALAVYEPTPSVTVNHGQVLRMMPQMRFAGGGRGF